MNCFDAHINETALAFFRENLNVLSDIDKANSLLKEISGVNNFFNTESDTLELQKKIQELFSLVEESNRREYGDFQTNNELANQVTKYVHTKTKTIEFILEPTCGKGNFIIAALTHFKTVIKLVGVEIYLPYVWETKFKLLKHFIENPSKTKPDIDIFHANAFEFDYKQLAKDTKQLTTLIIGNPPWVTNAELGSISSNNLPRKSNFKKHSGLDAITGKGNFDIGEYISLIMLNCFNEHNGIFAFLIKTSVAKNIISDQAHNNYRIANTEKLNIDAKKEFNVSVHASLFLTNLNQVPDLRCKELDFYTHDEITTFGWYKEKFVYSIEDYDKASVVDGTSTFIWRSGVKHDCSKIMEIERANGHYLNGLKQKLNLENDLLFGLLKSSDLKQKQTNKYRKLTLITQKKIGQETDYIKREFPLTYNYLSQHKEYFDNRKSSIYTNKPDFSIFGIGDYSFAPYKVAISGMYKSTHFTLVTTDNGKPIMLDDTCYFIGFDNLKNAQIAHYLLNSELVQQFLKSIIFSDSKRSITKDTLMRIDIDVVYNRTDFRLLLDAIKNLTLDDWNNFGKLLIDRKVKGQMTLF